MKKQQNGFSLIELSIVLVIIGLLIVGILAGRSLIRSTKISAQVSQIKEFDTATLAFRTKYDAIPGDMSNATTFFGPSVHDGNGDSVLRNDTYGNPNGMFSSEGEIAWFWQDLSVAGLISGSYRGGDPADSIVLRVGIDVPRSKFIGGIGVYQGRKVYFPTYSPASGGEANKNYFQIGVADSPTAAPANSHYENSMTVAEATAIDAKMDDGNLSTGKVVARGVDTSFADEDALGTCMASASPDVYDMDSTVPNCNLRIEMTAN